MSENNEVASTVEETEKERKNRMARNRNRDRRIAEQQSRDRDEELEDVYLYLQKAGLEAIMRELTRRGIKWSMSF